MKSVGQVVVVAVAPAAPHLLGVGQVGMAGVQVAVLVLGCIR